MPWVRRQIIHHHWNPPLDRLKTNTASRARPSISKRSVATDHQDEAPNLPYGSNRGIRPGRGWRGAAKDRFLRLRRLSTSPLRLRRWRVGRRKLPPSHHLQKHRLPSTRSRGARDQSGTPWLPIHQRNQQQHTDSFTTCLDYHRLSQPPSSSPPREDASQRLQRSTEQRTDTDGPIRLRLLGHGREQGTNL